MDFLINFKDVSFKYKGKEEPSIKNINLKIKERSMYSFMWKKWLRKDK